MKLYFAPGACSLAAHIVLCESGLSFSLVRVNLRTHTTEDGSDYFDIHPLGYVPLLELDDGQYLAEGPVILQYVADQASGQELAPLCGTMERYRLVERLCFISTELHRHFGPLFDPSTPSAFQEAHREKVLKRLQWLDQDLEESLYLLGERYSVADAYLFVVCNWCKLVGLDLTEMIHLQALLARVGDRPAVQRALAEEGSI